MPWRGTGAGRVLVGIRRRCSGRRWVFRGRGWDRGRAAISDNEELDALSVITGYKIVAGQNAGQNLFQGTRKTSADDFVRQRGGTMVYTDTLAEGFENMTHGVVLDPHLHLVAAAINSDLSIRLGRRKSR